MVAIVRYCRCKNANPKLAVLVPEIKFHYEVCIFYVIVFYDLFGSFIGRYIYGLYYVYILILY